jgi:creatinine amidohydrolase
MSMTATRTVLWQDLTDREIALARDAGAIVLVPVGAIEQHAGHLPVETDIALSTAISVSAARRLDRPVLVAPPLPYGFSPHHLSRPGTISLRLQTFLTVVREIVVSIVQSGFPRVIIVNGHGGNSAPLRALAGELVTDGLPAAAIDYFAPTQAEWEALLTGAVKRFGHACEFETAQMMAIKAGDPGAVGRIAAAKAGLPARTIQPWIAPGWPDDPVTAAGAAWPPIFQADDPGYFGDPAAASEEVGRQIVELVAAGLARFIEAFCRTPLRLGVARDPARPGIAEPLPG